MNLKEEFDKREKQYWKEVQQNKKEKPLQMIAQFIIVMLALSITFIFFF